MGIKIMPAEELRDVRETENRREDEMRVYVAGQYSRNPKGEKAGVVDVLRNIERGTRISVDLLNEGYAVFCPWLDHQFAFYDPDLTEKQYKENSMEWLEASDCVYVISGRGMGGGVDAEIEKAKRLGIPVFESIDEMNDWRYNEEG
jgi:hypothetical protein